MIVDCIWLRLNGGRLRIVFEHTKRIEQWLLLRFRLVELGAKFFSEAPLARFMVIVILRWWFEGSGKERQPLIRLTDHIIHSFLSHIDNFSPLSFNYRVEMSFPLSRKGAPVIMSEFGWFTDSFSGSVDWVLTFFVVCQSVETLLDKRSDVFWEKSANLLCHGRLAYVQECHGCVGNRSVLERLSFPHKDDFFSNPRSHVSKPQLIRLSLSGVELASRVRNVVLHWQLECFLHLFTQTVFVGQIGLFDEPHLPFHD